MNKELIPSAIAPVCDNMFEAIEYGIKELKQFYGVERINWRSHLVAPNMVEVMRTDCDDYMCTIIQFYT